VSESANYFKNLIVRILFDSVVYIEMGVKHWQHFQSSFDTKYFDLLAPDIVKKIAALDLQSFVDLPHIIFFGQDMSLLQLFVDAILKRVLRNPLLVKHKAELEIACNSTKHVIKFQHSTFHNEVDMEDVQSGQRQFLMEFVHKHISMTKTVLPGVSKRIVVLHSMDRCQHQFALRKILETCANNVIFIMTTRSMNSINDAICSRSMSINGSVSNANFELFFENFVEDHGIDEAEIDRSDGTTYTILNLGAIKQDDGLEKCVRDHIAYILATSDLYKIICSNREFAYKMLHFQTPCSRIFRHVINACSASKLPKNRIIDIIAHAADLEHKSAMMSKPSMLVERILLAVWKHGQKL